jgi:predicted RNA-binding protein YlxR (DUF448 family)
VASVTELVRIRRAGTELEPGNGPGRGAWLCAGHPVECLDEAQRRKAFGRALRATIEGDEIERLRARLVAG